MTYIDKIMNAQHFGSEPADIQNRIRINQESSNPDLNPGSLSVEVAALTEVCAQSSLL